MSWKVSVKAEIQNWQPGGCFCLLLLQWLPERCPGSQRSPCSHRIFSFTRLFKNVSAIDILQTQGAQRWKHSVNFSTDLVLFGIQLYVKGGWALQYSNN